MVPAMKTSDQDQAIVSPCIRLCTLNEHDVCLGCGRTMQEICDWRAMDPVVRNQALERARLRRERLGDPFVWREPIGGSLED